jgi:ribosomal protein S18 acetylase RimI-like enzyme
MKEAVDTRALTKADLAAIAAIHRAAFPKSAMTMLGSQAIMRYYAWQFDGPHDLYAIGTAQQERLVGFCFAGTFRGAISGFVQKNRLFLALLLVYKPWLLANPIYRQKLGAGIAALRRRRATPTPQPRPSEQAPESAPHDHEAHFGILSVAVDPTMQGYGIGKILIDAVEREARARQFQRVRLSVSEENNQAIAFYQRCGWQISHSWEGQVKMFKSL